MDYVSAFSEIFRTFEKHLQKRVLLEIITTVSAIIGRLRIISGRSNSELSVHNLEIS